MDEELVTETKSSGARSNRGSSSQHVLPSPYGGEESAGEPVEESKSLEVV